MDDDRSRAAEATARRARRVPLRDIWNWIVPWLLGVLLGCASLLGFLTASGARGPDTYAAGLFTAGLALFALIWLVKHVCDHPVRGWPFDILVERPDSLLLLIALLSAIGVGGLFLAADARGAVESAGYALFVVCLVFIGWNLKHHYDRIDSR
ncbi:MAG TPA: hypothetical protein VGR79_02970 [Stellaceae bacterium]|nr:hypothetical protein [Stellaceae bacterium]